jgi:dTDP-4-amino-4,6-dideoxygalactose transaminase
MKPLPLHKAYVRNAPLFRPEDGLLEQAYTANLDFFSQIAGHERILFTHSCTAALEMSMLLAGISQGDEVIMPSFTFVSAANAIVLRGGIPVFVDILPDTLNIDPQAAAQAVTARTRAVMPMHYGGVSAINPGIIALCKEKNLMMIEDNAHGIMAAYNDRPLGSIGHLGCFSFDVTKNIHCYKGGVLMVNDAGLWDRARIVLEKGTNRHDFDLGKTGCYTWIDAGSNFSINPLSTCLLQEQISEAAAITQKRVELWNRYFTNLILFKDRLEFRVPEIPKDCVHNGHIFYLLCRDGKTREELRHFLLSKGIGAAFHYVPLHSSPAGRRYGRFEGSDQYTGSLSERLLRLPLFHEMTLEQADFVCDTILDYFGKN